EAAGVGDVEEIEPEPGERERGRAESGRSREVLEDAAADVAVVAVRLRLEVRDDEVRETVAVEVTGVDAHTPEGPPEDAEARAREERDVLEPHPAEVVEDEVHRGVVRDVDVRPSVAVEIRDDHAEPLAERAGDPGGLRHVRERAVAVVAVEEARD